MVTVLHHPQWRTRLVVTLAGALVLTGCTVSGGTDDAASTSSSSSSSSSASAAGSTSSPAAASGATGAASSAAESASAAPAQPAANSSYIVSESEPGDLNPGKQITAYDQVMAMYTSLT